MDQAAYVDAMRKVAYLAGCAVREEAPDLARLDGIDVQTLLDAASRHSLSSIVAFSLQSAGIDTPQVQQEATRGVWRGLQLETDWQLVRSGLEAQDIWYCPLKGAVLKDLYPLPSMRQMSDYDVLFDAERAEGVRRVMEGAGFETKRYGSGSHDVYYKLPVSNFEMHRELFGAVHGTTFQNYYQNIKDRLIKDEDSEHGWHMSVEECYLYVLAHEYKHYASAGTGLRSPLDIYVYQLRYAEEMDWETVRSKAKQLGISDFEEQQRGFVQRLFGNKKLLPEDEEFFADLVTSGTYGKKSRWVSNRLREKGGDTRAKISYVARRLFPSLESVRSAYPFFYRHKVLLPALYVYRLGRAVVLRPQAIARELGYVWRFRKEERGDQ